MHSVNTLNKRVSLRCAGVRQLPADSPLPSLRPLADGYSTPPFVTTRRGSGSGGLGGVGGRTASGGWQRSSHGAGAGLSYPNHQYDSMIEDVVQQILNEASPESLSPLELGPAAGAAGTAGSAAAAADAAAAAGSTAPAALAVSRDGVTGVQTAQSASASAAVAAEDGKVVCGHDENVPLVVNSAVLQPVPPTVTDAAAPNAAQQQEPLPFSPPARRRSIYLPPSSGKRRRADEHEPLAAAIASEEEQPGPLMAAAAAASDATVAAAGNAVTAAALRDDGGLAATAPGRSLQGQASGAADEVSSSPEGPRSSPSSRRRPRKAARVDGGCNSAAAAAVVAAAAKAAAAASNRNLDELSNLGSEDSDSDAEVDRIMNAAMASAEQAAGAGTGAAGSHGPAAQHRGTGPIRGMTAVRAAGPQSLFSWSGGAVRQNASSWARPGLSWARNSGEGAAYMTGMLAERTGCDAPVCIPILTPTNCVATGGPGRSSPQVRPGVPAPASTRPAGSPAGSGGVVAPGGPAGLPLHDPDDLMDVPRITNTPRGSGKGRGYLVRYRAGEERTSACSGLHSACCTPEDAWPCQAVVARYSPAACLSFCVHYARRALPLPTPRLLAWAGPRWSRSTARRSSTRAWRRPGRRASAGRVATWRASPPTSASAA